MMSLQKNFIKNVIGFSLPSYVGALLSIVTIPIITRVFSPTEMGKINMFLSYYNILFVFCNMGYEQAFVRFFNEKEDNLQPSALAGLCLSISMVCLLLIAIMASFFYSAISLSICGADSPFPLIALCILLFARLLIQYPTLISRMKQDVVGYSIQAILVVIMTKCVYIVAVYFNPSYETAVIIMIISNMVISSLIFILFIYKRMITAFHNVTTTLFLKLSRYSIPMVPTFFLSMASLYLSQFILKKYNGFEAIGIYTNAVSMANVLTLIQSGFNIYWPAYVFANYKTQQLIIQKVHNYITFLITTFALLVILCQDILYLIVGSSFHSSKTVFPILVIVPVVYTIAETTRIGIRIAQKTYYELLISAVVVLLNYTLCMILIPRYAIIGAALGSAISAAFGLFIASRIADKYYHAVSSFVPMMLCVATLFAASYINMLQNLYIKYSGLSLLIIFITIVYKKEFMNIYICIKKYISENRKGKEWV